MALAETSLRERNINYFVSEAYLPEAEECFPGSELAAAQKNLYELLAFHAAGDPGDVSISPVTAHAYEQKFEASLVTEAREIFTTCRDAGKSQEESLGVVSTFLDTEAQKPYSQIFATYFPDEDEYPLQGISSASLLDRETISDYIKGYNYRENQDAKEEHREPEFIDTLPDSIISGIIIREATRITMCTNHRETMKFIEKFYSEDKSTPKMPATASAEEEIEPSKHGRLREFFARSLGRLAL